MVPLGSNLGTLLYIIYTNDIVQITVSELVIFADHISLVRRTSDENLFKEIIGEK